MEATSPLGEDEHRALAAEVRARGVAPVALDLGVPRSSLAAVLARVARSGTEALVAHRLAGRRARTETP